MFLKFETYSLFKNRELLKDREFYIEFNRGDRKEKNTSQSFLTLKIILDIFNVTQE